MTLHKKCKVGTAQTLNLHWECKNSKVDTAQIPQIPADLVTFTEEILNGKLNFLCSVIKGWINLQGILFFGLLKIQIIFKWKVKNFI